MTERRTFRVHQIREEFCWDGTTKQSRTYMGETTARTAKEAANNIRFRTKCGPDRIIETGGDGYIRTVLKAVAV